MYRINRRKKCKKNNNKSTIIFNIRRFCNKNQSIINMISALAAIISLMISANTYFDSDSILSKSMRTEKLLRTSNIIDVEQYQVHIDSKKTSHKLLKKAEEVPYVNEINVINEYIINTNQK